MANSAQFKQVLDEMWELHQKKNKDYGSQEDPYRNVRSAADWGIDPWIGALVRGVDKIKRLQKYAQTHELANEGAEDSLIDLAVYSVIALVLWREQYQEKMEQKSFTPVNDMETKILYADIEKEVERRMLEDASFVSPKSEGC